MEALSNELKGNLEKTLTNFKQNLAKIRTGRASTTLVSDIKVDYYGAATPLKQLANISTPESRLITIQPWDTSAMQGIEKAILKSDLGITPAVDGKIIRIVMPALTEDRRKELVKMINKMGEETKVSLRQSRRDAIEKLKQMEKNKKISEDDNKKGTEKVQKVLDEYIVKIDEVLKLKEKEIMSL